MSKDGKKPLGDSSVFQKGRKGAMRVIYGRTAIIAVSFLAQIILIGGVVNFFRPYIPMFFGGYMVLGLGIVLLILNKADVDGHHDAAASGWRGVICICGNAAGVSAVGETSE